MWPWEHAVAGYLLYSLFCHAVYRKPPGERGTVLVVFGSLLPDLIDKPLSWGLGIFESGYAIGHSVFFTVPLVALVLLTSRSYGRTRLGIAYAFGHVVHLAADVLWVYRGPRGLYVDFLLWPLVVHEPYHDHQAIVDGVVHNFQGYAVQIATLDPSPYLLLQIGVGAVTVLLWIYDGRPGSGAVRAGLGAAISRVTATDRRDPSRR